MTNPIAMEIIQSLIVDLRGQRVLLDSDVARIYGVDTKRINEAVKNNPGRFPEGYILQVTKQDWDALKSKFLTSNWGIFRRSSGFMLRRSLFAPTPLPECQWLPTRC